MGEKSSNLNICHASSLLMRPTFWWGQWCFLSPARANGYFFRQGEKNNEKRPTRIEAEKKSIKRETKRVIRCKACGHEITNHEQKCSIANSHSHTFFNPAGIVYEIGCFKEAAGCQITGQPTTEFSWFTGYWWRFALCSNCQAHLGWLYEKRESTFFGLILANLQQ